MLCTVIHNFLCMFSNYITTDGPGSIIIGPPYDMYSTKIIYSPIIHRLPAFPNINSRVELFNSLSDEHRASPSILLIPFILTHALFPIYLCVLFKNLWKPVADIISIALITCTKLFTQVHTVNLTVYITQNTCNPTIGRVTLYVLLLLPLSFLKVIIKCYLILLTTYFLIIKLNTNSSRTAYVSLNKLFKLLHYYKTLFSNNILTPFALHVCPIRRSNGLVTLIIKSLTILCTCKYDKITCFVYKRKTCVPSFNKHMYLFTYPRSRYVTSHPWVQLNVMIEQFYYTINLLSFGPAVFINTPIIPVYNHITHWVINTSYNLFCTPRFVYQFGGRETWVEVGGVKYGNSFYPP